MPVKRRSAKRRYVRVERMPIGVKWWLENGRSITLEEAIYLDLGKRAAWQISNLQFDRSVASSWTRSALRELGLGPQIDAHVAAGRCRPDKPRGGIVRRSGLAQ